MLYGISIKQYFTFVLELFVLICLWIFVPDVTSIVDVYCHYSLQLKPKT